jgi:hypothetical protein
MSLTCKEFPGQQHNTKRGDCRRLPNFSIVQVQSRACANLPTAELKDVRPGIFVELSSPAVLEALKEAIRTVRCFDLFDHFRNTKRELIGLFNLEDLLFSCTGIYP